MEALSQADLLTGRKIRFLVLLEFVVRSLLRMAILLPAYAGILFSEGSAQLFEYLLYSAEFVFVFVTYFFVGTRKPAGFTFTAGCFSAFAGALVVVAEQHLFFQYHDPSRYQPLEIGALASILVSFAVVSQACFIGHCCVRYGWGRKWLKFIV